MKTYLPALVLLMSLFNISFGQQNDLGIFPFPKILEILPKVVHQSMMPHPRFIPSKDRAITFGLSAMNFIICTINSLVILFLPPMWNLWVTESIRTAKQAG